MRLIINDKTVVLPTSLSEFTLGQRIAFQNEYGKALDDWLQQILAIEDETMREIELTEYQIEKCFRTFAFFAGCTPEALKESEFIDDIANIYHSSLAVLFEDEDNIEFKTSFEWKGDTWVIHPPELKQGSKMTFGEFIESKQVVKDLVELGAGKWEAMLRLCAIYLRKTNEEYNSAFLEDQSARMLLMTELPMDIALAVGFFLSSSTSLYRNTFPFSGPQKSNRQVSTQQNITTDGAGSTS
jgi:hypothetical protein